MPASLVKYGGDYGAESEKRKIEGRGKGRNNAKLWRRDINSFLFLGSERWASEIV